ncbi:MAG: hypothetical protein JKY65_04660, partial [Planctomycetes bacterium]|nr:hypothetical protein [Planctomycetota bacterium]
MTPLTPECTRARNLLDRRLEEELLADVEAGLESHLSRCVPCRRAADDLQRAYAALAALSLGDGTLLSSPLADLERERSHSLRVAIGSAVVAALLVVSLGVYLFLRAPAPPPEPAPASAEIHQLAFALPEIGGGLGVETDPDFVLILAEAPPLEAAPAAIVARPDPAPAAKAPAPNGGKGIAKKA